MPRSQPDVHRASTVGADDPGVASDSPENALRWYIRVASAFRHPVVLGLALAVCALALVQSGSSARGQDGGIMQIAFAPAAGLDHVDPALSFTQPGWALLDATCARLMTYPDKAPPAGFRLQPEVAAGYRVSNDLKTFTFTLRKGFRFSNGAPVRASAFAHAIKRLLQPFILSPGAQHVQDVVGAKDVLEGRRPSPRGVVAKGNTLVVRFTKPAPDFPARTALPFFCAVPPNLPSSGEGVGAFPSAGPYFVQEYRPGERVVIRRNPHYGGARKFHLDGFDVDLRGGSPQEHDPPDRPERGRLGPQPRPHLHGSDARIAREVRDQQGPVLRPARPHVANACVQRVAAALPEQSEAATGDQLCARPPGPRCLDRWVARRSRRPTSISRTGSPASAMRTSIPSIAATCRERARSPSGNLRSAKAVFYTTSALPAIQLAQPVSQQLARIGLELDIRPIPLHISSAAYLEKLAARGEDWDLALVVWTPNIPEPHAYLNQLLENQFLDGRTLTGFRSRIASRELRRAARTLQAQERARAYADLDAFLARTEAPLAALNVITEITLVSDRVGCIVLRPVLDLAVACLKS